MKTRLLESSHSADDRVSMEQTRQRITLALGQNSVAAWHASASGCFLAGLSDLLHHNKEKLSLQKSRKERANCALIISFSMATNAHRLRSLAPFVAVESLLRKGAQRQGRRIS